MSGDSVVPANVLPYFPPVSPDSFLSLWIALITLGVAATGSFFVYEAKPRKQRSIVTEFVLAAVAALLLGFGSMFLLLWFGVWL